MDHELKDLKVLSADFQSDHLEESMMRIAEVS